MEMFPDVEDVSGTPPPRLTLSQFIYRVIAGTRYPIHWKQHHAALLLLWRLSIALRGQSQIPNRHTLFLAAWTLAMKQMLDHIYSNKAFTRLVLDDVDLKTINDAERWICAALNWNLAMQVEHLWEFSVATEAYFVQQGSVANHYATLSWCAGRPPRSQY
jgi:hypothetical protein